VAGASTRGAEARSFIASSGCQLHSDARERTVSRGAVFSHAHSRTGRLNTKHPLFAAAARHQRSIVACTRCLSRVSSVGVVGCVGREIAD